MTMATGRGYDVEVGSRALPARTLGALLNETFAVYGRRFRRLVGLVAVVQLPVSLLELLPGGLPVFILVSLMATFGGVFVFGAIISAVGQDYLLGAVDIARCYSRAWWRVVSLAAVGTVLAVLNLSAVYILTTAVTEQSPAASAVVLILSVPILTLLVYSIFTPHAIIVEGLKPIGAVRRSYSLVRGSWWRVFGIFLVILLVTIGLALLVSAPFAFASWLAAPEEPTGLSSTFNFLGGVIVGIAVAPVVATALTLLYYDLRVRKEDYDLTLLSKEMGMAAA